jgi:hypothetical protein
VIDADVPLDTVVGLTAGGYARGGVVVDFVTSGDFRSVFPLDAFDGVFVSDDKGNFNEAIGEANLTTGVANLKLLRILCIKEDRRVTPRCGFHSERGEGIGFGDFLFGSVLPYL